MAYYTIFAFLDNLDLELGRYLKPFRSRQRHNFQRKLGGSSLARNIALQILKKERNISPPKWKDIQWLSRKNAYISSAFPKNKHISQVMEILIVHGPKIGFEKIFSSKTSTYCHLSIFENFAEISSAQPKNCLDIQCLSDLIWVDRQ